MAAVVVGERSADLVERAPAELDLPSLPARRLLAPVLCVYLVSRIALVCEAAVIAHVHHLAMASILQSWDGGYYASIAQSGYPLHASAPGGGALAFLPLFPFAGHFVSAVTGVSVAWSLLALSLAAGGAAVTCATLLVDGCLGLRRARQAGVAIALFPGSAVLGLTYADGLAVALALAAFLALDRRRFLLAGLAGAAATASLSLLVVPVLLAVGGAAFVARSRKAVVAPALTLLGAAIYPIYLWVHTGSPLSWARAESLDWHVRLSLPWMAGTAFHIYALRNPEVSVVTIASLLVGLVGIVALVVLRAPRHWLAFAVVVLGAVLLDNGTWMTPRFVFDAFPTVLALGAIIPRRAFLPIAMASAVLLVLLYAAYVPPNWTFYNP